MRTLVVLLLGTMLSACAQAASECTAARCTPEEANNLNFDLCNAEVDLCQICIDTTCECIAVSPSDQVIVDACMETYQMACVEATCVGVDEAMIDKSCLPV